MSRKRKPTNALERERRDTPLGWFAIGASFPIALLILVALAIFDVTTSVVIIGIYAVPPFLTAVRGDARGTAILGALAVLAAAVSGVWNENAGSFDHGSRLLLVALASMVAYWAATSTARNLAISRQLELLNEVAAAAEDATPSAALAGIGRIAVPELADICLIDVVVDDRIQRVSATVAEPRKAELEPIMLAREPTIPEEVVFPRPSAGVAPHLNTHIEDADLVGMAHSPEDLELLRSLGVRSFVATPLISRGRRIGAMTLIQAWSGRRQDRADAQFARVLGGRAALVLDNSGLMSDLESVERRMDVVMEALDEAVVVADAKDELVFANRAAVELMGCESVEELIERTRSRSHPFRVYAESGREIEQHGVLPGIGSQAPDVVRILRDDGADRWIRIRARSVDDHGNRLFGVYVLSDVTEIKLEEQAHGARAAVSELLLDVSGPEILAGLASTAVPRLGDACAVYVPGGDDENEFRCVSFAHQDPDAGRALEALVREYPLSIDEAGLANLLESGAPFAFGDLSVPLDLDPAGEERRIQLNQLGLGSLLVVPLITPGKLIGVMIIGNGADRIPLGETDIRIARRIADRIALSVENARIVSERNEIALTLQAGLQSPPVPDIPGWSFAASYRPAGAENRVGGDFYDFFRIEDGWMAAIGDVTGHGARAATVTALARYTLRTAGSMTGSPVAALSELNRSLLARPGGALCTVVLLAMRNDRPGRLEIAVAGHPPPVLIRAEGADSLDRGGPMLGAFDDATWSVESIDLDVGDGIVLYTDGLVEAREGDERFGLSRVLATVNGCHEPAALVSRLDSEVIGFSQSLEDDAAVVAGVRDA